MSCYEITGGQALSGSLAIHGAKNSVLPILAACLLVPGQCVLHNCPDLSDVSATLDILRLLGCRADREGDTIAIDASALSRSDIPDHLMREMRSSVIFLGALLARIGTAELSYPGGCELGPRPIDLHLSALRALGAEILEEQGALVCRGGGKRFRGREICLSVPSVGATENAMLAACGCPGLTTIVGAAQEPEIVDLQNFLQAAGAQVTGAGTPTVAIQGGRALHPAEYAVMGDRIAAATYLCGCAAAGGEIEVTGLAPDTLTAVLACLKEAGCNLHTGPNRVALASSAPLRGISPVRTAPYPSFPTDAQAILMAALAGGEGATLFVENIFDSRYRHVDELRRMGADIQIAGRAAMVSGVGRLHGAAVRSTDLRGGAALVVAALGAEGVSQVSELRHIKRGYQALDKNLRSLGADIREVP
ncbi:MAG: UDP-N-acetylglucosamine 1-carboxyvinyltransferase [Lawsonibacter sp.]|nr:UDP-N-acetylglucosamine 1-carboxyvinyltransferase [Lawsonibacter sp.]